MHIKLGIGKRTWVVSTWKQSEYKYKMRVRTQQCPCFKNITAGCTAAKFPILFFAAVEQGKNSHVLLAKRKA